MAEVVWERFGNVVNYVEPFFGSGAVLLSRPHEPANETVNDLDCYLANFWRAVQADPAAVAGYADWPVNEADLHARHLWLVNREGFRERMKTDPDYFDAKIAGWWVWGISMWIGSGWCSRPEWRGRSGAEQAGKGIHRSKLSRHTPL
ncbi:MAG TPA: DNA adenine methylase, partial [Gammaproteobacteria bacterium]|nr:DNA adenine methylase [Gammaproteobacteria bacterium]